MNTPLLALLVAAVGCLTSGCASSKPTTTATVDQLHGKKLDGRGSIYVAIAPDAFFKSEIVVGSGKDTAIVVRNAFSRYTKTAYLGRDVESFTDAMNSARRARCGYMIYPSVIRWEDRATEFSGLRDEVEVKLEVVEVATAEVLHSTVIKGKGKWMTDGGLTPKDILIEPLAQYAGSLFQIVRTPSGLDGLR